MPAVPLMKEEGFDLGLVAVKLLQKDDGSIADDPLQPPLFYLRLEGSE